MIDAEKTSSLPLEHCLYFTASAFARRISVLADNAFRSTHYNPSQAFALLCIHETPGISLSALAERIHLAPSTITRHLVPLQRQGLVRTSRHGRIVSAALTSKGAQALPAIRAAWHSLQNAYDQILTKSAARAHARRLFLADQQLLAAAQTTAATHTHRKPAR